MGTFVHRSIASNLSLALSSQDLWINIAKTVIFILAGFYFIKKKKLPENTGGILTKFVMTVCLPCLAFCSFMSNFTVQGGVDALVNFVLGFVFYVGFIFLGKLLFAFVKDKSKREVLAVLFAFGSTTFFGYPLVVSLYGAVAGNNFNIMNVAYRVFLYSYAYLAISGAGKNDEKTSTKSLMKTVFLNPIVIATMAGLVLWLLQAIPATAIVRRDWLSPDPAVSYAEAAKVALWRFDVTLPWIFQAAKTLGNLASTIILFAIGCTLGGTNIADAAKDRYAWIWTILKVVVAPSIVLLVLFLLELLGKSMGFPQLISADTVHSSVITWMVPPATVAVGYCINFNREKEMASHISLIATFGSVLGIVLWVLLLTIVDATGFFPM